MTLALVATVVPCTARAAEHVTLRNGFEVDCVRREVTGDRVRLYLPGATVNYLDVAANDVVRVDWLADVAASAATTAGSAPATQPAGTHTPVTQTIVTQPHLTQTSPEPALTQPELHELLTRAGAAHNIDADLLASVVRAESGGQVRAVSRAGAQGLMQLMPGTASQMGVQDTFRPEQNIAGGTAYLDALLDRYHDNLALALAAYNAGPAAVDRYHGVPPYRETQAYVARVIREFNRRKQKAHGS
ncbi:MAG: lytic transglycosylase domain-containing protein [Acidobacteriota bacterium]|nr:lytic transglycosylase domain-containing protein [Acidobacteriota bacterium]